VSPAIGGSSLISDQLDTLKSEQIRFLNSHVLMRTKIAFHGLLSSLFEVLWKIRFPSSTSSKAVLVDHDLFFFPDQSERSMFSR
jgi:hypothetical protein